MRNKGLRCLAMGLAWGLLAAPVMADDSDTPYEGAFYSEQEKIHLKLNLYDDSLYVPGMEFLGGTHGYMHGNIYGVWMVTSFKLHKDKAVVRLSNDSGSDAQSVELTLVGDSALAYKAVDGNEVKRAVNRKLVKIPAKIVFKRLR